MVLYKFSNKRGKTQDLVINDTHITVVTTNGTNSVLATQIIDIKTETKRKHILFVFLENDVLKFYYDLKHYRPPSFNESFGCMEETRSVMYVAEKLWELKAKNS